MRILSVRVFQKNNHFIVDIESTVPYQERGELTLAKDEAYKMYTFLHCYLPGSASMPINLKQHSIIHARAHETDKDHQLYEFVNLSIDLPYEPEIVIQLLTAIDA